MTITHTYAILKVSPSTYREIKEKLEEAGYQDQFHAVSRSDKRIGRTVFGDEDGILIDMHGIALSEEK